MVPPCVVVCLTGLLVSGAAEQRPLQQRVRWPSVTQSARTVKPAAQDHGSGSGTLDPTGHPSRHAPPHLGSCPRFAQGAWREHRHASRDAAHPFVSGSAALKLARTPGSSQLLLSVVRGGPKAPACADLQQQVDEPLHLRWQLAARSPRSSSLAPFNRKPVQVRPPNGFGISGGAKRRPLHAVVLRFYSSRSASFFTALRDAMLSNASRSKMIFSTLSW